MFRQGKVEYPMSSGRFPSGNKVITFVMVDPVFVFSITKVRIAYDLECFVIMANPGADTSRLVLHCQRLASFHPRVSR
jgi:hypothetical protein